MEGAWTDAGPDRSAQLAARAPPAMLHVARIIASAHIVSYG